MRGNRNYGIPSHMRGLTMVTRKRGEVIRGLQPLELKRLHNDLPPSHPDSTHNRLRDVYGLKGGPSIIPFVKKLRGKNSQEQCRLILNKWRADGIKANAWQYDKNGRRWW